MSDKKRIIADIVNRWSQAAGFPGKAQQMLFDAGTFRGYLEAALNDYAVWWDTVGVSPGKPGAGIECNHCGAKMVEYKFTFNHGLAVFLYKLYKADTPCKTDNLNLTYSQRTNSQKLRYWGLAIPHLNKESAKKAGWWIITEAGKAFVEGRSTIWSQVIMYRNKFVRWEGEQINFAEVTAGYDYRSDYQDQIREQDT